MIYNGIPTGDILYDVFEADQFESARARLAGDAVMEVMLQIRPNGRCLNRIALDGTVLETQISSPNQSIS